jgi:23S rRNA (cytidine2498-2'-O)-methyltransferase
MSISPNSGRFLFVTCQMGAEKPIQAEVAQLWPDFRFAYSRPGFLTFKLPEQQLLPPGFKLGSVFARAYGFSLGSVDGSDPAQAAKQAWELLDDRPIRHIHAWERDRTEPGVQGFEPTITSAAQAAYQTLRDACPCPERLAAGHHLYQEAAEGDGIADCILVTPDEWWIGYHRARSTPSRWPGAIMHLDLPADVASRAWLKMEEALRWSPLPAAPGARFAELGSAPGGASQALLARGYEVIGIDPAKMSPKVLEHPKFRHIRRRVVQVPRRELRKVRWLTADMNVAPNFTLDAVEAIVTYREINIRGMLLTLKLPEWSLAAQVPEYLSRLRSCGFNLVRARQLTNNRREICVAALQKPFKRKPTH